MHSRTVLGQRGERCVVSYLRHHGYTIIATNVSWHQQGEIDIVAQKDEFLVCVEVKTRHHTDVPFGVLVPRSKQKKIIKVARWLAQRPQFANLVVRFDVAFVDMTKNPPRIEYVVNAFFAS